MAGYQPSNQQQKQQMEVDDLGIQDPNEMGGGDINNNGGGDLGLNNMQDPYNGELSLGQALLNLFIKAESGVRSIATNRLVWLLQARREKIRQGILVENSADDYKDSAMAAFSQTREKLGVLGIVRGISPTVFTMISSSIVGQISGGLIVPLTFNGLITLLSIVKGSDTLNGFPVMICLYGAYGVGELALTLYTHPCDVITLNVACELPDPSLGPEDEKNKLGIRNYLRRVKKNEGGYRALYRGYSLSLAIRVVGMAIKVLWTISNYGSDGSIALNSFSGISMIGKIFAFELLTNALTYPLACCRTRQILSIGAEKQYQYRHGFNKVWAEVAGKKSSSAPCASGDANGSWGRMYEGFHFNAMQSVADVFISIVGSVLSG